MNNTTLNVPRELLERLAEWDQLPHKVKDALTDLRALLSAPSPAGVDGLEVQLVRHLNTRRVCYMCAQRPRNEVCGLCDEASSAAQAIIDGLRGEVDKLRLRVAVYNEGKPYAALKKERDQQTQRIGELEGLLRMAVVELKDYAVSAEGEWGCGKSLEEMVESKDSSTTLPLKIDAALSAGKEGE